MEIKRVLLVYDQSSEELIDEIVINTPVEALKSIFVAYENDPDLIMSYDVHEEQAAQMKAFEAIDFDLINNIYQMECYQA